MSGADSSKKFEIESSKRSEKTFKVTDQQTNQQERFIVNGTTSSGTPQPQTRFAIEKKFSRKTNIDTIIRKMVSPDLKEVLPSTEIIVSINSQNGRILPIESQKGVRSYFTIKRHVEFYWVSTQNIAQCQIVCPIENVTTRQAITIQIVYEVHCLSGNQENLVRSLYKYKENDPGKALEKSLITWIRSFEREKREIGGVDFIENYFLFRDELQDYISSKAQEEFGLRLQLNLTLEHESQLTPFPIHSSLFSVRVKDCDDDLRLRFTTELYVEESNKIAAILQYNKRSQLEYAIQEQMKKSLLEHFTLNDFCYELNRRVQMKLIEDLREILFNAGHTISYLSLASPDADALIPEDTTTIEHVVQCRVKGCPSSIEVEHRLLMSLENLGKFQGAKIDRLEDWAKNKLDQITQAALFEKTYVDLLLAFNPEEIKQKMEAQASAIGYTVRHLTAIPNLEPLKLKDGFKVEIEEETFVTLDTRVKVKLQLIVTGVIRDLRSIERYLNPQINIVDLMKETIREEAEQLIHIVDPERFYMRFYYTEISDEKTVEQELREKITRKLEEGFHASQIIVTSKLLETEITKRFQELQKGYDSFEFEIFPIRDKGYGEAVKFQADFKVRGVDKAGWYTFQANDFQSRDKEIENIKRSLEGDIKTKLETVPISLIQYTDIKNWKEIKDVVDLSIQKIISVFGLVIEVVNLRRLPTISELGTQEGLKVRRQIPQHKLKAEIAMAEKTDEDQLAQLDQLFRKRRDLIETGIPDDDPEMVDVNQKIQKIIQEKPAYSIESDKQHFKQLRDQATPKGSLKAQFEDQAVSDSPEKPEKDPGKNK